MKQPTGHDVAIHFFATCLSVPIDPFEVTKAAAVLNSAAATYGPEADDLWQAATAAVLGEYEPIRQFGIDIDGGYDDLKLSHHTRLLYRLRSITKQLERLT